MSSSSRKAGSSCARCSEVAKRHAATRGPRTPTSSHHVNGRAAIELVKHILSFDLGTTFAVASRVNRTWKQLALSQLSSITSLTISYSSSPPLYQRTRAKHPLAHRTLNSPLVVVPHKDMDGVSMEVYADNVRRLLRVCCL